MCTRADSTTAELEPAGKHGVWYAPAAAHDDTTVHNATHDTTTYDTTTHDTTSHDTATATTTTVRRHDDANSTIHGQPEPTVQQDEWRSHGTLLL